jgi:hypothetical protein
LSEAFIDEMEITNVSRGRPPRVFHFDPFVEERAAGRTPSQATAFVARDLASVMMFLAHREDVVIAQRPRLSVLRDLHRLGVEIPQFVPSRAELGERLLGAEAPWGTVEQVRRVDKVESLRIRKAVLGAVQGPLWAHCLGRVCRELADAPVGENFIAKSPLSASGQHRVHLEAPTATAWLERRLRQGPVVIEPWYERVADVSLQLDIGEDEARNLGVTRFWTAGSGAYRGAVLGPWSAGMDADALRGLHGGGKGSLINDGLADVGRLVGAELHAMGIRGPVGVDCMVVKQDGAIRFLPVLEVNPRFTMGRVALELHRSTGLRGGWFIVDDAAVTAAGHSDRASFIAAVEGNAAAVFTTDPWSAERVLTVMVGAKNTAVAKASWESLGFDWPD